MRSFHVESLFLCTLLLACGGTTHPALDGAPEAGRADAARAEAATPSQGGARTDAAVISTGGTGGSIVVGSGGAVGPDVSKDWGPPVVSPGTMVDPRDGNEYKTVTINGLTWMAGNLRYIPSATAIKDGLVRCGNTKQFDRCSLYGAYYSTSISVDPCPAGWRLPKATEFQALFDAHSLDPVQAATKLRDTSWDGTNDYGFSALPAGYYNSTYDVSDITNARVPIWADYDLTSGFLTGTTTSMGYSYRTVAWIYNATSTTGVQLFDDKTDALPEALNARCVQ
jgi:uncharacterized protein (TIGR02145 family)